MTQNDQCFVLCDSLGKDPKQVMQQTEKEALTRDIGQFSIH